MNQQNTDRLAQLNAYQVAGLAIVTSALAAGAVLLLMRRFVLRPHVEVEESRMADELSARPAVETSMPTEIPHHFSENAIVPGKTATGAEISEQDSKDGRSPEGV